MIDQSYFVSLLPEASERLNVHRANYIEENLFYLIRQWPAFEVRTLRAYIGLDGHLLIYETASPAEGVEVTLLQNLPRLLVLLEGDGVDHVVWSGDGWAVLDGEGEALVLACVLDEPSEDAANKALRALTLGSTWDADLTVSLAAERLDGSLRLVRRGLTQILFRAWNTWGRLRRQYASWAAAGGQTWAEAKELRKEHT